MGALFTDDWVLQERAARLRASGRWNVEEIAHELGCSRRSVYRMLPKSLRRGNVWVYSSEGTEGQRKTFRRWHEQMKAAGLPRNGSMTIREGRAIETGRREPWPFVERG